MNTAKITADAMTRAAQIATNRSNPRRRSQAPLLLNQRAS